MRTVVLVVGLATILVPPVLGQPITIIDTVYTPAGYGCGDLVGYVYVPSESNGVGVIIAHGGPGSPRYMSCWAESLAAHGCVAMTFYYPNGFYLKPFYRYPIPVTTFKIAVEFLRRGAERFGITTGKVVGLGFSLGAAVWGQSIIWDNDDTYFGTDPAIDDGLDAAILFYGWYDNENYLTVNQHFALETYFSQCPSERYARGNPIANVANINIPILLVHGQRDVSVLYQQSVQLHDTLLALGKVSQLLTDGNWTHAFDNQYDAKGTLTAEGKRAKDTVVSFLAMHVLNPTGVVEGGEVPKKYVLSQNYPNPFNPSTTIEFSLPNAGNVTLKVYNVLGEEVATLIAGEHDAGTFKVTWDASGMPSGIYFYRLTAGEYVQTEKAILMK